MATPLDRDTIDKVCQEREERESTQRLFVEETGPSCPPAAYSQEKIGNGWPVGRLRNDLLGRLNQLNIREREIQEKRTFVIRLLDALTD